MWSAHVRAAGPFHYLYVPYGPAGRDDASLLSAIESARSAGKSLKCDFVRIEPATAPSHLPPGTRRVRSRQPDATWRLNLEPDEAELRKSLTKGHKGSINSAPRKGLTFRRNSEEIDTFLSLLHGSEKRAQIESHSDQYFRDMISALPAETFEIYFADHDGKAVATAMSFRFGGTTYYAYAGADPESRPLSPAAPLVWQMILEAKQRGDRWFDFWGITTSTDPNHPWAGFSQFKRSFGGELVQRAGTYDIVLHRARYLGYLAAQKIRP